MITVNLDFNGHIVPCTANYPNNGEGHAKLSLVLEKAKEMLDKETELKREFGTVDLFIGIANMCIEDEGVFIQKTRGAKFVVEKETA